MKKLLLLFSLLGATAAFAEAPLFRIGFMTDTHIRESQETLKFVKAAFALFHKHKVDIMAHLGDMAERHIPQAYVNYRNALEAEFANDVKPMELYIMAWHDQSGSNYDQAFENWKTSLKVPHEKSVSMVFKGFPILLVPQDIKMTDLRRKLDALANANPGKPIIVLDHVPPCHTTDNTDIWGGEDRREVYNDYPQVIHVSGHTHGELADELNIWQDDFSAVSAGSLTTWAGLGVGHTPAAKMSYGVLIMDAYADKLVFHRYNVLTGEEYKPEEPWTIPLPFDRAAAPYSAKNRADKFAVPQFAPTAALSVKPEENTCGDVKLSFPEATSGIAHHYDIDLQREKADGKFELVTHREIVGKFGVDPDIPQQTIFSGAYFETGANYLFTVTPVGYYGKRGKAIELKFTAPEAKKAQLLFASDDPMKELKFTTENGSTVFQPDKDGIYDLDDHGLLNLPDVESALPADAKIRISVDMQISCIPQYIWTMSLHQENPNYDIQWRTTTCLVDFRPHRLVLEFVNRNQKKINLLFYNGKRGKIKFNRVRIERM